MAPVLPGIPVDTLASAKLPPASPFCQLAPLPMPHAAPAVHAVPAADPASQLATLQPGPSSDLVSLWLTSDPSLPHAKSAREEFLTWGDWELPSLF